MYITDGLHKHWLSTTSAQLEQRRGGEEKDTKRILYREVATLCAPFRTGKRLVMIIKKVHYNNNYNKITHTKVYTLLLMKTMKTQ